MVSILKKTAVAGLVVSSILLMAAATGNIRWDQLNPLFRNGTDAYGQSSDGTHTSGDVPSFDSNGGLTATYGVQGTDTKLLSAGTVSGTSSPLCTDGNGGATTTSCPAGSGTVTSVALSMPGMFNVSGSPVTTAGTLTASLANQSANLVFAGPSSGGAAAPTFRALATADLPSTTTQTIASGTAAMGTSAIASGSCATVVTVSASGVASTDNIMADFTSDPTSVTGYGVNTSGTLTIYKYPTTNNVNFKICNSTAASITPGSLTLNWRVVR